MRFTALFTGALCLNLFALITIRLRPKIFKVKIYKPMLANFKLSIRPLIILAVNIAVFVILSILSAYLGIPFLLNTAYVLFFAGLLIWLLYLPNCGYLITELNLNHRTVDDKDVPIWYDIVSTLSFALSGIVNALLNIVIIQISLLVVFDPPELTSAWHTALFCIGFVLIVLITVGIYLGRAIRLNSRDIIHPYAFAAKLKEHFSTPGTVRDFLLNILFNTIFFVIMYISLGIPFYFIG